MRDLAVLLCDVGHDNSIDREYNRERVRPPIPFDANVIPSNFSRDPCTKKL